MRFERCRWMRCVLGIEGADRSRAGLPKKSKRSGVSMLAGNRSTRPPRTAYSPVLAHGRHAQIAVERGPVDQLFAVHHLPGRGGEAHAGDHVERRQLLDQRVDRGEDDGALGGLARPSADSVVMRAAMVTPLGDTRS